MNSYRFNQIAMAVLGALLLIFGTRTIIQIAFEEHKPEKPGHEVAKKDEAKPGAEGTGKEGAAPAGGGDNNAAVAALVAKADPAKGEGAAAMCKACHSVDKDAASPIGPPLYNVVGRKIASVEGFNYSPALKAKAGEVWDYAHLDAMIHNPAQYAPGTMMAFPGIPDAAQRADVIAWLRTKADKPFPLPEGGAAAPAAEEKPAEAAPPAAEEKPAEAAPPAAEEAPAEATPPAAEEKPAEAAPPAAEEAPAEATPPAAGERLPKLRAGRAGPCGSRTACC